ncbi:MAG: preprotein translocase subunit SecA [Myxococcota bacterium]
MGVLGKVFGTKNERELRRLWPRVHAINALEAHMQTKSDAQLTARLGAIRTQLQNALQQTLSKQKTLKREDYNMLLDPHLHEVFALVREASRRVLGMRHFDVQLLGGMVLHRGQIAEMKTGEGKTLVATLPAVLAALLDKGVHVVTVNDYLAARDAEWMGRIYRFLGLSVGVVLPKTDEQEKKRAYRSHITYGQNNEFGFDYLRDNMKFDLQDYVQREHFFAIVDEVDSILIDEARTPLIISGPAEKGTLGYKQANALVPQLRKDEHYTIDEKSRVVVPTEAGVSYCEQLLKLDNLYDPANIAILHHVNQALRAHCLFKRDVDYVVESGEVIIVDEHTGRLMPGRRWSDGLHQAVEAKESVSIQEENQTLATVTFQNFFRMYNKLSGMTGTADTEAEEFAKIYDLDVMVIPTNRTVIRKDEDDLIYKTESEKFEAVAADIKSSHDQGQPVLVGTVSVEKSEVLAARLNRLKIPHNVLNAKHHRQEASIVAQAGRLKAVTIATNMAGRGTDILLGGNPEFMARTQVSQDLQQAGYAEESLGFLVGRPDLINVDKLAKQDAENPHMLYEIAKQLPTQEAQQLSPNELHDQLLQQRKSFYEQAIHLYEKHLQQCEQQCEQEKAKVVAAGGLRIIATERHESRRIDNQLRGRAGRQGDPGSSSFYLSLQDDLMRIFGSDRMLSMMQRLGMEDGVPIEHPWVSKSIASAQKRVEGFHFDSRKQLIEYDDVMNQQRKAIYALRRSVLAAQQDEPLKELIFDLVERAVVDLTLTAAPAKTPPQEWRMQLLEQEVRALFGCTLALRVVSAQQPVADNAQPTQQLTKPFTSHDDLLDAIFVQLQHVYNNRAQQIGPERFELLQRLWYLQTIDHNWREQLQAMDHLREGIHFRGYAQKDPKQEYKQEGFALFQTMMASIRSDVLERVFQQEVNADSQQQAQHELDRLQQAAQQATLTGPSEPTGSVAPQQKKQQPSSAQVAAAVLQHRLHELQQEQSSTSQQEQDPSTAGLNRKQRRLLQAQQRKKKR